VFASLNLGYSHAHRLVYLTSSIFGSVCLNIRNAFGYFNLCASLCHIYPNLKNQTKSLAGQRTRTGDGDGIPAPAAFIAHCKALHCAVFACKSQIPCHHRNVYWIGCFWLIIQSFRIISIKSVHVQSCWKCQVQREDKSALYMRKYILSMSMGVWAERGAFLLLCIPCSLLIIHTYRLAVVERGCISFFVLNKPI